MRTTLFAGILLLSATALFGQTISNRHDMVVFTLSPGSSGVPAGALSGVNQQIRDVFANVGPYVVTEMAHTLSEDEIPQLMERLKEHKTPGATASVEVIIGSARFSTAELQRLLDSRTIVVPVVTSYSVRPAHTEGFTVELDTSFTLINGQNENAVAHFAIKAIGVGPTADAATRNALGEIPRQLAYDVRTLPGFQPPTQIVGIGGSMVLIGLGRDKGVRVGDEFAVVSTHELPSGKRVTKRRALLLVKDVKENIAYARVIYSTARPSAGDRLEKISRIGFESSLYVHVVAATEPLASGYGPVFAVGTLHTVTRGLYNLRPILGFEVPLTSSAIGGTDSYSGPGLPLNVYAGAELNWRIWRIDITPLAAVGIGGTLPFSTTTRLTVTVGGGIIQISASYLITPKLKVFIDAGAEQWLPLGVTGLTGWGGFYGGIGVKLDY